MHGNYKISYNKYCKNVLVYVTGPMHCINRYLTELQQPTKICPLSHIPESDFDYIQTEKLSDESYFTPCFKQEVYYQDNIDPIQESDNIAISPISRMRFKEKMYYEY